MSFHLELKPDLADGVMIENYATIYFDDNDPIIISTWSNIFDRISPKSAITGVMKDGQNSCGKSMQMSMFPKSVVYKEVFTH